VPSFDELELPADSAGKQYQRDQNYRVGSIGNLNEEIVGVDLKSPAFSKYYVPPANFSNDVTAHTP
jgi:hypothetical protein